MPLIPDDDAPTPCSQCGGLVKPFGRLRQWFCVNDDVVLCLSCARRFLPEQVAIAEGFELYDGDGEGTKES